MKATIFSAVILFKGLSVGIAQSTPQLNKVFQEAQIQRANDIEGALDTGKAYFARLVASPQGAGARDEVGGGGRFFPRETHVAWIHFTAIKKGNLAVVIIPDSTQDDYDFLLFKDEAGDAAQKIAKRALQPIRSNCARSQYVDGGRTGLAYSTERPHFVGQGTGSPFVAALQVEKGDHFYLAVNNVYDNGAGAIIRFEYFEEKLISGVVTEESGAPVESTVTWEDRETGDTLAQTTSDPVSGKFSLTVPYRMNSTEGYNLVSTSPESVFTEALYSAVEIHQRSAEPLALVLPELKKGKRIGMGSINFIGGKAKFIASAYPSLMRLHKLMKANPKMKIQIEGHTNGCDVDTQNLSNNRAKAVKDYLMKDGILIDRMTTEGLSCRFMLYPEGSEHDWKNRRVEILVTFY